MTIDVLLLGSGGREHALAWKLARSPELGRLFAAPGNPGIGEHAELVPLDPADQRAVLAFCKERRIGLVVIGPEAPLVAGLADALEAAGVPVFGPTAAAARLEGSKGFTKDLCSWKNIPTAAYRRFDSASEARAYIRSQGVPIVVKADGLAAGKGVVVAQTLEEALQAVDDCFGGAFGAAGGEVVVEEFLQGEEASLFCLCDGRDAVLFGTAQDHKRAFDGDQGPNTGGMGAYSPALDLTEALIGRVMREIIAPTLEGMNELGCPFRGVLYAGLMLTAEGPKLIEYNVRFGDPECQVLMMRLRSDLLPLLQAAAAGGLAGAEPVWAEGAALTVVVASRGYPGRPAASSPIGALPAPQEDAVVFQAGTSLTEQGQLVSEGGRVLNATATGSNVREAAERAYALARQVDWPGGFYRSDIGARAFSRETD